MNDQVKQYYDGLVRHSGHFLLAVLITLAFCLVLLKFYLPVDKGVIESDNSIVSMAVLSPEVSPEIPKMENVSEVKERVIFGDMAASTENYSGINYVTLYRNGVEGDIIDSAYGFEGGISAEGDIPGAENMPRGSFFDLKFSPAGKYLTYRLAGYEWSGTKIYDIKNNIVLSEYFAPSDFGFFEDEKYFYDCQASAYTGEFFARVFDLTGFEIKYDMPFEENEFVSDLELKCEYDMDKKVVKFILSNFADETGTKKIVEYSIVTNKAEVK